MIHTFRPLQRAQRKAFDAHYLDYLQRRNGQPDFDGRRASRREAYALSVASSPLRAEDGSRLIDPKTFFEHQLARRYRRQIDDATLWAICSANVNFTEQFGVDYGFEVMRIEPGSPLSWIMIEETYHTRLLLDCVRALGADVRQKNPKPSTALLVKALSRLPHRLTAPLILCTELVAICMLEALWARGRAIFRAHPVTLDRIDGALRQIIVDEVGHVRHLQAKMGRIRLGLARALCLPLALGYLLDLPELRCLLGWRPILERVLRTVRTGKVVASDGTVHPLDVLTGHEEATRHDLEAALAITTPNEDHGGAGRSTERAKEFCSGERLSYHAAAR